MAQDMVKKVCPCWRMVSAEGAHQVGMSWATPMAWAYSDWARYCRQSKPWNGAIMAIPAMK